MIARKDWFGVIKSFDAEARTITGFASTPDVDRVGDIVEPGAFRETIASGRPIPLLFNHDQDNVIGRVRETEITSDGLRIKGRIVNGTRLADETWRLIEEEALTGFSIGFLPIEFDRIRDGNGVRHKRVDLLEVSVVTIPANPGAVMDGTTDTARNIEAAVVKQMSDRINGMFEDQGAMIQRAISREVERQVTEALLAMATKQVNWRLH